MEMGLMQSAVWVQEVTVVDVCKLKTEIASCSQTTSLSGPEDVLTWAGADLCSS